MTLTALAVTRSALLGAPAAMTYITTAQATTTYATMPRASMALDATTHAATVQASPLTALVAGLVAGLAIALPMGAISVLLVQEGLTHGLRTGLRAAAAVASVDGAWSVVAVIAGSAAARVLSPGVTRGVQVVGAGVLVVVAVRGLWALRRPAPEAGAPPPAAHTVARFVGLTALNPMTIVYFTVLTLGLGRGFSAAAGATFCLGVLIGSGVVQVVFAGAGALAHGRLPARARDVTAMLGSLLVLGYAVKLAAGV